MRTILRRGAMGMFCLVAALPTAHALDLTPHSFSRSRQFVVYSSDAAVRGGVGSLADDTKAELLNALGLRDEWKLPIVIDLRPPPPSMPDAAPVRLSLAQTSDGLKIELDLLTGEAGRGTRIRNEIVRTLLLELAYRDVTDAVAGQGGTLPPTWLVEGFSAYLENVEDGVSASMFAALLPTTQALPLQQFLAHDPTTMDSTSRGVYQAYAYTLVCLLLRDVEGGREGLLAFIHDLPRTPPAAARDGAALMRHFPALAASPDALEKWWTLGLAHLADEDRVRGFSAEETDQQLQALLTFPGPSDAKKGSPPKNYTLSDFQVFTPLKQNAAILEATRAGLAELSARANPLTQPIVRGYQEVVAELSRNRTGGVGDQLRALEIQRRDVLKLHEDIADYMNWYEATQVSTESGAFENYFRASRQIEAQRRAHRPDPISAYLDELETEFH